eukprot:g47773.t1
MGPQWWLKTVIEQVYANGIRNIDLHFIICKLAAPVIAVLLLSLCLPYVIAAGIVPLLGVTTEMQNLVQRRIYPLLLMVVILMGVLSFQIRQFKRLYEHIKNDKVVKKVFDTLICIAQSCEDRSWDVMLRLYRILRPLLEYCVQFWSPCYRKDIVKPEGVQKRFTRILPGMEGLSYKSRRDRLGLLSL